MLNAFKTFFEPTHRNALLNDSGKMLPLLRWFANNENNIDAVAKINRTAFWVDKELVYAGLYYNIDKSQKFIKYPKQTKQEKNELLLSCLKKYFRMNCTELEKNWGVIEPQLTKEFLQELALKCGLEQKECKELGVEFKVAKFVPIKEKPKGLMAFC